MRPSKEIRWFFPGGIPSSVLVWMDQTLSASEVPAKHEARSDTYLIMPSTEVGLKLRGPENDKVEVKRLECRGSVPVRLGASAEGYAELWIRWSFNVDREDPGRADPTKPAGAWIVVCKTRDSRKFALSDDGSLTEVHVDADVPLGGTAEVTHLTVRDVEAWSVALEVFGPIESLDRAFEIVARHVFAENPLPIVLNVENSESYPSWLNGLANPHSSRGG